MNNNNNYYFVEESQSSSKDDDENEALEAIQSDQNTHSLTCNQREQI